MHYIPFISHFIFFSSFKQVCLHSPSISTCPHFLTLITALLLPVHTVALGGGGWGDCDASLLINEVATLACTPALPSTE